MSLDVSKFSKKDVLDTYKGFGKYEKWLKARNLNDKGRKRTNIAFPQDKLKNKQLTSREPILIGGDN